MKDNKSVTVLNCKIEEFYMYWVIFTKPFHKLRNKECRLLAEILYKRYELSKLITDESLINKYLFSLETKEEIRQKVGMKKPHFFVSLTLMREAGVLSKDNIIETRYIPNVNIEDGQNNFNLLYQFKITDDK